VTDRKIPDDALLPSDTHRSLPIALLRAREAVMAQFRPVLATQDVTEQQWRVIRVLAEASALDATELAERACILAPSLTRILRTLEERGVISRNRDQIDGRRLLLSLTPKGFDIINAVSPSSKRVYADLETRYGRERLDHLLDLLGELAALK
jgi:homoprotocatechuate degradation regulator HpaR